MEIFSTDHALFSVPRVLYAPLQLPTARPGLLRGYAELWMRAWSLSDGQARLTIESRVIQPMLHTAVYGAHAPTCRALRRVLNGWHEKRKQRGVDEMLARLYQPILWRGLKAANPLGMPACSSFRAHLCLSRLRCEGRASVLFCAYFADPSVDRPSFFLMPECVRVSS